MYLEDIRAANRHPDWIPVLYIEIALLDGGRAFNSMLKEGLPLDGRNDKPSLIITGIIGAAFPS